MLFSTDHVPTKSRGKAYADLVLRLSLAADRHSPTVAGVLGIAKTTACARLRRKSVRERARVAIARARRDDSRALWRRCFWRRRLRALGIDPATLTPDDPAWAQCHRYPRGYVVRVVAAQMRAEHPGIVLAEPAALVELLDRVAVLVTAGPAHPALVDPPPGVH